MREVIDAGPLRERGWSLNTGDAHELYGRFGFVRIGHRSAAAGRLSGMAPGWLQRLGFGAAQPKSDDWVEVAQFRVSGDAAAKGVGALVERVRQAGIEVQEKPFVEPDRGFDLGGGPDPSQRVEFALLVHRRDLARASKILEPGQVAPISDEELARQAEQAGEVREP